MADHNIQIDVIAKNLQETVSLLRDIRDDIKTINSTPVNVKVNTASATRALNELRKELSSIATFLSQGNRNNADAIIEGLGGRMDELINKFDEINSKEVRPDVDYSGLDEAISKTEQLASGLDTAAAVASGLSSIFSGLGDFGGLFADSFGAMSDMFSFDTLGTAKRYLTAMATKAVTGQVSGILQRYDIMNTFVPYMELAGVDQATAEASLNAVDMSIRGIPIGLDEAAFRLRKYQMYLGDIDRATQFTIGIQKAITAGGASEQMKTTAYTQIDRLLATGKLGQSRQWLSLFNGMGVSLKFLKQELDLDPTADLKTVAADLANGTIATEDFIDAITRLAENPGLDKAIGIYKGTIEAWRSNINNAIKRGGQNILENINSVLDDIYGQGITGFMKNVRDGIDTVSKEAGAYIKENPQNIQTIGDAVGGLIDRVAGIDGGRFVENLVTNISGLADGIGRIFDSMPPGFLEDFTAFATTWAGPMATLMKAAQGGVGVVLGVFERMKGFDMPGLMEKISDQIWAMADAVSFLLGLIPDGLLGDLMAFGLVWGRPLASVLSSIGGALKNISGALSAGKFSEANGVLGQLTWIIANHPALALALGTISTIATMAYSVKQQYDQLVESVLEENGLDEVNAKIQQTLEETDKIKQEYETTQTNYGDEVDRIRSNAKEASELLDTILETDEKIGKLKQGSEYYEKLYEQQYANIEKMKELAPELASILELDTNGRLANVDALKEQGDAYIEYVKKMAEADAARQAYRDTYAEYLDASLNRQKILRDLGQEFTTLRHASQEQERLSRQQRFQNEFDAEETGRQIQEQEVIIENSKKNISGLQEGLIDITKVVNGTQEDLKLIQGAMYNTEVEARNISWSGLIDQIKALVDGAGGAEDPIDTLTQKYTDLKNAAEEALIAQQDLFKEVSEASESTLGKTMGNISGNLDKYGEANRAMQSIISELEEMELPELTRSAVSQFATTLVDRNDLDSLIELGNLFEEGGALEWITGESKSLFGNRNAAQGSLLSEESYAQLQLLSEVGGNLESWKAIIEGTDMGQMLVDIGDGAEEAAKPVEEYAQASKQVAKASEQASTGADMARTSIQQAGGAAQGQTGNMGSLADSFTQVSATARFAASSVQALARAISSLQDKTVHIRVAMSGGGFVGGALSGFMNGTFAKGGPVDYLAGGGFPGIGRGTDTVAAWLTPGEYVMRRSAVGLFGSRFMDRVNKMDIGGAFDALMARISNPMMHGNTYNRDNHAQVINNFYGNSGQDYSQRKAYRYVGSL